MTKQRTKPPGSGMQKGFRFDGIFTRKQHEHIYETLPEFHRGRKRSDETRERMREAAALVDQQAARRKMWLKRRNTWVCVAPDGRRYTTVNMRNFCKKHGLTQSHMSRIAHWYKGDILAGSRYHKGWECWMRGKKNRIRTKDGGLRLRKNKDEDKEEL